MAVSCCTLGMWLVDPRPTHIKPSSRKHNTKSRPRTCPMALGVLRHPRQARPDTTDVTWTHGTTADLGQSGGSAGWAGQKKALSLTYPTTKFLTAPVNMALGGIGISFRSTQLHFFV